mgnify:CR=1 FL=1
MKIAQFNTRGKERLGESNGKQAIEIKVLDE